VHQNTRSSEQKQIPRARDGGLRQDGIGRAGIVLSDLIIFMMVGGLIYVMASPNRGEVAGEKGRDTVCDRPPEETPEPTQEKPRN
jgi:hypothetical protein